MIEPIYQPAASRYEDGMTYRRAGRSGVLLPAFSLGMWHNFGSGQTFSNVRQMAHYAFDRGIVHFDLANNYGPAYGTAEENFGRLMEQSFRPYRDELFISTKAGYDMWPGPYGNWGSRMAAEGSLRRDVLTERMSERIRGLHEIAQQRGQTLAEMALAWLLRDKRVTSVIIGASSVAQIEDNLRALEYASFSDDELAKIDALSRE